MLVAGAHLVENLAEVGERALSERANRLEVGEGAAEVARPVLSGREEVVRLIAVEATAPRALVRRIGEAPAEPVRAGARQLAILCPGTAIANVA